MSQFSSSVEWKSILRDNQIEKLDELCNKHILLLRVSQRVVKPFYKIFIQKVFEKPLKSQNKWPTGAKLAVTKFPQGLLKSHP
jgi:hypothetical protein